MRKQPITTGLNSNVLPLPSLHLPASSGVRTPAPPAPVAAPDLPQSPNTHLFEYRGRNYRLYKKPESAMWYFRLERDGQTRKTSMRTADRTTAVTQAKLLLEAADKGKLHAMRAVLAPRATTITYSPLAKILDHFENRLVLDIGFTHRRNAVYSAKVVLSVAGALDQLTTSAFSEATARKYFAHAITQAQAQPDQESEARVKRSANSTWSQAACLLRPKCLAGYKAAGLVLPDVAPFLRVFEEERFTGICKRWNPPGEKLIRTTLHAWLKLTDRNMFIAAGLELACGLRKGEVQQTTWEMFTRSQGHLLDGRNTRVKSGRGCFIVPPIDPFWRLLNNRVNREKWRGQPHELVLTGSQTDCADNHFRAIGLWMRGLGWKTQKTNHALRAYAGSLIAMKFGIYRASAWLRHSSVKVTEQHYTHFLNERVFRPESVRVRWAR